MTKQVALLLCAVHLHPDLPGKAEGGCCCVGGTPGGSRLTASPYSVLSILSRNLRHTAMEEECHPKVMREETGAQRGSAACAKLAAANSCSTHSFVEPLSPCRVLAILLGAGAVQVRLDPCLQGACRQVTEQMQIFLGKGGKNSSHKFTQDAKGTFHYTHGRQLPPL